MAKRPHKLYECRRCQHKQWHAVNKDLLFVVCKKCHTVIVKNPHGPLIEQHGEGGNE